jgi:signal transduction histidine kinase
MTTTPTDLVDRLAAHRTLGAAPREELAWLAEHGSLRQLDADEVLTPKTAEVEWLYVLLSGRIALYVDRGTGLHKLMEWRAGDVTGQLPYSRLGRPPADTVAQEPSTVLRVHRDHFPEMISRCHQITSILVRSMVDRARSFNANDLHDEKMVSLGRLSAGLAHELNNPASAIERSAALLEDRLDDVERAARALGAVRLTEAQLAAVDGLLHSCHASSQPGVRSPLEQSERENAVGDWLDDHRLDTGIADGLADTDVTFEALDHIADVVDGAALDAVLRWAAAGCAVRTLAAEIQEAATRVAGLVVAIKGFTHMDQATVAEPLDVVRGLSDTVAVLRSKAREKSAAVTFDVEPGLPRVLGFAGELNQIWSNLIDNALDAVPAESGRVELRAAHAHDRVVVSIVDNGEGIPDSIRDRIFDPFFTTKAVGHGTGLGLDIVRRLVRHNAGDISVESRPGRTEFCVALPVADHDNPRAGS